MLNVKNGSFSYPKSAEIFSDVNFEVNRGELMAILGPNGAGKTTMLRCIMGMLKWSEGESLLDLVNIVELLPCKELHFDFLFSLETIVERLHTIFCKRSGIKHST